VFAYSIEVLQTVNNNLHNFNKTSNFLLSG